MCCVVESVNDHNFKVVITALDVVQKVVELEGYKDESSSLEKLVLRLQDPKTVIRA